jgi:hypothetical protein
MTFQLDLPAEQWRDGQIVYQYAQLVGDGDDASTTGYMSIGCRVTFGDSSSAMVENFEGLGDIAKGSNKVTGKTVNEMNADDKVEWGTFNKVNDESRYEPWDSWMEGNRVQECIADFEMDKTDRDGSVFKKWKAKFGARIYRDENDTQPIQFDEKKSKFTLEEPDYENGLVDTAVTGVFTAETTEAFNEDYVEKEVQFLGQKEAAVDTSALEALGVTGGQAKQTMYTAFEVNEFIDKPDDLSFYFNVDLPKDILKDGTIIYQWA